MQIPYFGLESSSPQGSEEKRIENLCFHMDFYKVYNFQIKKVSKVIWFIVYCFIVDRH